MPEPRQVTVCFRPGDRSVLVPVGTLLSEAAAAAGLDLAMACGGHGTCGQCLVQIVDRDAGGDGMRAAHLSPGQVREGYVLACQTRVDRDVTARVPDRSLVGEGQIVLGDDGDDVAVIDPAFFRLCLDLPQPTLTENADDLERLRTGIGKRLGPGLELTAGIDVLRRLPGRMREQSFQVTADVAALGTAWELVDVRAGHDSAPAYGVAVDLGTTTVVADLVDLASGRTLCQKGTYNRQGAHGDDVITRIVYAEEYEDGPDHLRAAAVDTINGLVREMAADSGLSPDDIRVMAVAGNTTMIHLLLGVPATHLRLDPYIPALTRVPPLRAREVGLAIDPGAWVHCLPGVSSYVGGDITAGILAIGLDRQDEMSLFIDVGTNGEMVLGNRDWLLTCSCSAGPAFEGVGLTSGMRAMKGAIEGVWLEGGGVAYRTVGGSPPAGICGSGLIDLIAVLWEAGAIDRGGRIVNGGLPGRTRAGDEGPELVVVPGCDSAGGDDIAITEGDIRNLIRSKGAVYAALRVMLSQVGMETGDLSRVVVAGGFGSYLDVPRAIEIGLLPDLPVERFRYAGNTSLKGARLWLLSGEGRRRVEEVAARMTYLELSAGNEFMDEFTKALFLPHTELDQFPSVVARRGGGLDES